MKEQCQWSLVKLIDNCNISNQEESMATLQLLSNRTSSNYLIAVLSLLCYWNSLSYDLVHDDVFAIKENKDIRSETPIWKLFQNDFWGKPMSDNTSHKSYRPLCTVTFRLNYFIHGLSPFGYHLVNVLLHTAVSVLFCHVCDLVIFQDRQPAVLAGMLFAVHPVHTEAVTGVVGRADVLCGLIFLLTFYHYVRYLEKCDTNSYRLKSKKDFLNKKDSSWSSLVFCVLLGSSSMLVKEHGITVFGVCIVYDVIRSRDSIIKIIFQVLHKETLSEILPLVKRGLVLTTVVILLLIFRLSMLHGQLPGFKEEDNPASFSPYVLTRIMTYCYLCAFNVWLLLSPITLSYDWQGGSIPLLESISDARNLGSVALLLVLLAIVLSTHFFEKEKRNEEIVLLGLAFLIVPFLPASNLFLRVGFVVAERILYIPSLGYCILIAHGFNKLCALFSRECEQPLQNGISHCNGSIHDKKVYDYMKTKQVATYYRSSLFVWSYCLLVLLMAVRTVDRNSVWKNRENLFRSGVKTLPHNAKAHYNYGNFLKDNGKTDQAIMHYREAVRLYPKHFSAHNNLATLLGESEEAIKHYKLALKYNPYHCNAMFNLADIYRVQPSYINAMRILADVLLKQGDRKRAEEVHKSLASKNPQNADTLNNYGTFLAEIGKSNEALKYYQKALAVQPNHTLALLNLGRQLKKMNKYQEAEKAYRRALAVKRESSTLKALGVLLYQVNRTKEAELSFLEALRYEPDNLDLIQNHATAVYEQGQRKEAVLLLKEGLRKLPISQSLKLINLLVNFLVDIDHKEEAMTYIDLGLANFPEDIELHHAKANTLRLLGKMELAELSYKDVLKLDPDNALSHMNLGALYHLKGSIENAQIHYDRALQLDPNNEIIKDNLRKLKRMRSQYR